MTLPGEGRAPRRTVVRRHAALFSTPLELGLRVLIVLDAMRPLAADLQRLVAYDYLLVHSGDAGGPESVHPSTPHRSAEILVKRDVLRAGLQLMLSRDLVEVVMTERGVRYIATDLTSRFLAYFEGSYVSRLRERARWLGDRFSQLQDDALQTLIAQNLDKWGGEFTSEALVRHVSV
jgi:hypothetical protein